MAHETDPAVKDRMAAFRIDAHRVGPRLYQGSFPKDPDVLAPAGFDVLVLCAEELQAEDVVFPGVIVIRCPLNDDGSPMTRDEWVRAQYAGIRVAKLIRESARVLVTCHAGRNRSGLVNAVALYHLYPRAKGGAIVRHIQKTRPNALTNRFFADAIRRLP